MVSHFLDCITICGLYLVTTNLYLRSSARIPGTLLSRSSNSRLSMTGAILRPVHKSAVIVYSSWTIELYLLLQQFWMTSPRIMLCVDGNSNVTTPQVEEISEYFR